MADSTFVVRVRVPRSITLRKEVMDREAFYSWIWSEFGSSGLLGVHEGTVLSEQAARQGFETESWTVDAGEAPQSRDWIRDAEAVEAELYFDRLAAAEQAAEKLRAECAGDVTVLQVREQQPEDWDADWKASFPGVRVPPFWNVLPPWKSAERVSDGRLLVVNPGAGFGTGTHETTQLCLTLLGEESLRRNPVTPGLAGCRVLDFGSGSGILAIAAALLGARPVDAVEIDPLALENAAENERLNGISGQVRFARELSPEMRACDIVVANILKSVLLEFAGELTSRLAPAGLLILSGLMEGDVPEVLEAYRGRLPGRSAQVRANGDWRAVLFAPTL